MLNNLLPFETFKLLSWAILTITSYNILCCLCLVISFGEVVRARACMCVKLPHSTWHLQESEADESEVLNHFIPLPPDSRSAMLGA